ncbi:MAG TPA: GntR family transcriptional regulator [Herbaspirillum sp.]|jgi:GntR family transcriptional regulator
MKTGRPTADQPLYEFVQTGILDHLQTGKWAAGERIPTEPQLAKQFDVGIGTIRRAVDEFVAKGLLIRRAGRGTLVATLTDQHVFDLFFSFVDKTEQPIQVTAQTLKFAKERANAIVARKLGVETGARLARVDNLRLLAGKPVMLDRLWISLDIFHELDAASFSARGGSIYGHYQEHYGVSVVRVAENLSATSADEIVAGALGIAVGTPVLCVERTAFTFRDRPVEYRLRFVDTTQCSYRNIRGLQD